MNNSTDHLHLNMESMSLICFGRAITSYCSREFIRQQLQTAIDKIVFINDMEKLREYAENARSEIIFILSTCVDIHDSILTMHELKSIESIFIMHEGNTKDLDFHQYKKIIGYYSSYEQLHGAIKRHVRCVYRRLDSFTVLKNRQRSIKNISKDFANYLWFQLFSDTIMRFPFDGDEKETMLKFCREYYQHNPHQLRLIQKFEEEYSSSDAIRWYTKASFIYTLTNYALRTEDMNLLRVFRFYLRDLLKALASQRLRTEDPKLLLYRGSKLSLEEFNEIKQYVSKTLSTNGFWSTSRSRKVALSFAPSKTITNGEFHPVLFEIECDMLELDPSVILVDVSEYSEFPEEQEIIFGLNACFKITSISHHDDLIVIKLSTSNEHLPLTKFYLSQIDERIQSVGTRIMYGRLLLKKGDYDIALKYFDDLLNNSSLSNDEKFQALRGTVEIWCAKGNYLKALECCESVCNLIEASGIVQPEYIARVFFLSSITFYRVDLFKESMWAANMAKEIWTHIYSPTHHLVAKCFGMICFTHVSFGNISEAIQYAETALALQTQNFPPGHIEISHRLHDLGYLLKLTDRKAEGLNLLRQAVNIRDAYYPNDHILCSLSRGATAEILQKQEDYLQSLTYWIEALEMRINHIKTYHPMILSPMIRIGDVLSCIGENVRALKMYFLAMQIIKEGDIHSPIDEIRCLDGIGNIYQSLGWYEKAMTTYRESMRIKHTVLPNSHIKLVQSFYYLGQCRFGMKNYKLSMQYYRRALRMGMKILPDNHNFIIAINQGLKQTISFMNI